MSVSGRVKGLVIRRNILVCGDGPALQIGEESMKRLDCDENVYFVFGGPKLIQHGVWTQTLALWREATGQDALSRVADPGFVNPNESRFELKQGSAALKVGAGHRWK